MERERRFIFIYRSKKTWMGSAPPSLKEFASTPNALKTIARWANLIYVDRLTKKQQAALAMIDMLDAGHYVEGVGYWLNSYCDGSTVKAYVVDC